MDGPNERKKYVPARRVQSGFGHVSGCFASRKMNRMVQFESTLERDAIHLLEYGHLLGYSAKVVEYYEQPIKISDRVDGKHRTYYPDFLCVFSDGRKELWEVKPTRELQKPRNQEEFKIGEKYCSERGCTYRVLTEKELREGNRLKNIQFLSGFRRKPFTLERVGPQIVDLVCSKGPLTIFQIAHESLPAVDSMVILPCLYHLIYREILRVDVDQPFNSDTQVKIARLSGGEKNGKK